MMNKPVYKVDLFRDIVSAVSAKLTPDLKLLDDKITGVHYKHGHPIEILTYLQQLSEGKTTKYDRFPLVALFQDFPEEMGDAPGFYSDDTYHLIIARGTEKNYSAEERYEENFKPFLYPVYFELLNQIRLSRKFEMVTGDQYRHTKFDRLFWGREGLWGNTANSFDDKLDCIEIKNLKLRSKTQNC